MTSTPPHQSILDKPFVLDLFAGPGGLDSACHRLGIPSLGIEWDKSACLTRYAAGLDTLHADVSAVRRESFESLPPEINVLAGGPPCQTYSVAGKGAGRKALEEVKEFINRLMAGDSDEEIDKRLGNLSDPRTALVLEPLRYAIQATRSPNRGRRPYDVIVLEQVPAVRALWDRYAEVLQEIGLPDGTKYEVVVDVLNTETYGVPQTRSRAVLIARRAGLGAPSLPEASHRAYETKGWNRTNVGNPVQATLDEADSTETPSQRTEGDEPPLGCRWGMSSPSAGRRSWSGRTTAAPEFLDDAAYGPTASPLPRSPVASRASWSSNLSATTTSTPSAKVRGSA